MKYKELVKHHTQLIKDQNQNKWEVIETSDLEEICEAYHQDKLKLLGIGGVVGRSEQLNCDHEWKVDTFDCYGFPTEQYCDKCDKKEAI